MDCDRYARLPRAAKQAAEAIEQAIRQDAPCEASVVCQLFAKLFAANKGLPTLALVLEELARCGPLFARVGAVDQEQVIDRIERIEREHGGSTLDLILTREARRAVVKGDLDAGRLLGRVVSAALHRTCVDSQRRIDGKWEQAGDALRMGGVPREKLRALLVPAVNAIVPKLLHRPDARRLTGLPRPAHVSAHTDLM